MKRTQEMVTVAVRRGEPEPPPLNYVLTMDQTTALVLLAVLGSVHGSTAGPRSRATALFNALERNGLNLQQAAALLGLSRACILEQGTRLPDHWPDTTSSREADYS